MQIHLILINIILSIIIQNIIAIDDISLKENFEFPDVCSTDLHGGDGLKDCANSLSTLIWNSHTWYDDQPISVCKLKCKRKLKGHVNNLKWVWDAKFGCGEEIPEILGKADNFKIRRNAMKQAIAQSIEQAITLGRLTLNDFKC